VIVLYTANGCPSCRKAKKWFKDHNISFIEKNIFSVILKDKEILYLLKRTENGTDDIISKRSKVIQEAQIDFESMSINELITFVRNNPSCLKRPIIISDKEMQIGYDNEEIEAFIPRINEFKCEKEKCPHYYNCGYVREES